ncbi:MAG: T9SS type A sorting domain-containing protein [Prolixibacteraceae bacterium]|nr:T9SS type A sorting domain-containing protein [Prolixibacteraceae bacterium]
MKKVILIVSFIFFISALFAQEVVSSAGKTQNNSGYEVSWTVGEPVISTIFSESNKLTQGFQQSKLIITAINKISNSKNVVTVFPNPTNEFAVVKYNQMPDEHSYSIFDLTGRCLKSGLINSTETQINLVEYAKSSYLLKIFQGNGYQIQTFKIIKQ